MKNREGINSGDLPVLGNDKLVRGEGLFYKI
jgi:hypothetical protein